MTADLRPLQETLFDFRIEALERISSRARRIRLLDLGWKTALPTPSASDHTVELKEIKAIIDLMKENDLSVFEMEKDGFKLKLQKEGTGQIGGLPLALQPAVTAPQAPAPAAKPDGPILKDVVSPMVGTFYRAASADSSPFVEVGKTVDQDTVVCIIEAMKVMNEIKAEISGVVAEVVAENGKPVQFGQVLFRVR
jgi:acetyl-CoA carboxylase biotin carboxyl carrier protein